MPQVAIVDYGASNLDSVRRAVFRAGTEAALARSPEEIVAADRLILPGVGAAGEAVDKLRAEGLDEALSEAVRTRGRPFLGICLGMQLIAERLREFGDRDGLGWIRGEVVPLDEVIGKRMRVPHMGWNRVRVDERAEKLFRAVRGDRSFYFAHSFTLRQPDGAHDVVARTDYGAPVAAAVLFETVFATQFHPEKSQINGDRLVGAFLEWSP